MSKPEDSSFQPGQVELTKIRHDSIGGTSREELDALRDKAIVSLKNDKDVYPVLQSLHLTQKEVKEYLADLLSLQEDRAYCKHCPGLADCAKEQPHFQMNLSRDEKNFIDVHFDPCPLALEQGKRVARYFRRDFPEEWLAANLNAVDHSKKRNEVIMTMVSILTQKSNQWLYLSGGKGSGKSFVLACFANTYSDRVAGKNAFVDSPRMLEELKNLAFDSRRKDDYTSMMNSYETCPLLVLDGFGGEYVSEYNFSNFLFPILSSRAKVGLMTCFSSEISMKDVCSLYQEKIGPVRAKMFYKMLTDNCKKEFDITGLDVYSNR